MQKRLRKYSVNSLAIGRGNLLGTHKPPMNPRIETDLYCMKCDTYNFSKAILFYCNLVVGVEVVKASLDLTGKYPNSNKGRI